MARYIYSGSSGVFLFDENFNLIERKIFNNLIEKNLLLEKNEWLEEEKELIEKYKNENLFFIGIKKEKKIKLTQDIEKLEKIVKIDRNELRNILISITKNKIKNSVGNDLLIVHAINSIEELNKTISALSKRLREWYELYCPEFSKSISDNEKFSELITTKEKSQLLREIGVKESMGPDFKEKDLQPILELARALKEIYILKKKEETYLDALMKENCPNIREIAGSLIGANLINLAGSLESLAKMPASKIQLLGAEKAFFRHLKDKKHKSPKYGILHEHYLVAKAVKEGKGKIARVLADKICIAAKVDYFRGNFIGDKLKKQLEEKFR